MKRNISLKLNIYLEEQLIQSYDYFNLGINIIFSENEQCEPQFSSVQSLSHVQLFATP